MKYVWAMDLWLLFSASQVSDFHKHVRQMSFQRKAAGVEAFCIHRPCLGSSVVFGSSSWCSIFWTPSGSLLQLEFLLFDWSQFLQPPAPAAVRLSKSIDFQEISLHTATWYPDKRFLQPLESHTDLDVITHFSTSLQSTDSDLLFNVACNFSSLFSIQCFFLIHGGLPGWNLSTALTVIIFSKLHWFISCVTPQMLVGWARLLAKQGTTQHKWWG